MNYNYEKAHYQIDSGHYPEGTYGKGSGLELELAVSRGKDRCRGFDYENNVAIVEIVQLGGRQVELVNQKVIDHNLVGMEVICGSEEGTVGEDLLRCVHIN